MDYSVQSSSVAQSCPTLCDPMNHSTPGLPVHHQLPEFTQTHVHRVSDAIQPSHPLSSLLLLSPIPPSIRVFSNESTLRMRWPKYWSFSFSMVHIRPKSKLNGDTIPHQQRGCLKTSIVSSKHAPKHGLALHRAKTQFHSSVDRHWPFAPGSLH